MKMKIEKLNSGRKWNKDEKGNKGEVEWQKEEGKKVEMRINGRLKKFEGKKNYLGKYSAQSLSEAGNLINY